MTIPKVGDIVYWGDEAWYEDSPGFDCPHREWINNEIDYPFHFCHHPQNEMHCKSMPLNPDYNEDLDICQAYYCPLLYRGVSRKEMRKAGRENEVEEEGYEWDVDPDGSQFTPEEMQLCLVHSDPNEEAWLGRES